MLITSPRSWVELFLREFRDTDDGTKLEIVEGREGDLHKRLVRGRLDLALTVIRDNSSGLAHDILFTEGYSLARAATHPLADRKFINAAELANEPMLVRRNCELLSQTSRFFTKRDIRPLFPARTTCEDRALGYVREGLGVTVMPNCFEAEGVVRPRIEEFDFVRTLGLVYGPDADNRALRSGPIVAGLMKTVNSLNGGWIPGQRGGLRLGD